MGKIFLAWMVFMCAQNRGLAQDAKEPALSSRDSLELLRDLMALLDSAHTPTSYVFLNVGIGNRLFSIRNNVLNAKQTTRNTFIYSPSLGYFHKSGFSFTAGANILNDGKRTGINQYSITPAFDLRANKRFDVGLAYTHYFVKDKYSSFSSPVQNDFFASLKYKKTWIQPGFSVGYSNGEYKEALHRDTIINGILRRRYDSITYKLNALSITVSAGHQFLKYGLFNGLDGLSLTPTLMLNAGSGKTEVTHRSNVALINYFIRKGRIPRLQTNKFEVQSIGLNLDLVYTISNFTFEPQVYMDYYLPATDSERFSTVFAFNIGYSF